MPRWSACTPRRWRRWRRTRTSIYQAGFFDGRFTGWADFVVREDGRLGGARHQAGPQREGHRAAAAGGVRGPAGRSPGIPVHGRGAPDPRRPVAVEPPPGGPAARCTASAAPAWRTCSTSTVPRSAGDLGRSALPGVRAVRRLRRAGRRAPGRPAGRRAAVDAAGAAGGGRDRAPSTSWPRAPGRSRGSASRRWPTCAGRRRSRSGRRPRPSRWCSRSSTRARSRDLPVPDAGDIFFDFEGDPLWTDDTVPADQPADWGLEYLFGVVEADGRVPAVLGARPRAGEAGVRRLPRLRGRAPRRAPGHARLPLRPLRADGAAPARGPARRRRGRGRPAAARRGARRPVRHRAPGPAGGQQLVLAEEARAALHGRRRAGARDDRRRLDHRVRRGVRACATRANEAGWQANGSAEIADYNRYDCVSTLRLRDWLLAHGPAPTGSAVGRAPGAGRGGPAGRGRPGRRRGAGRPPRPAGGRGCSRPRSATTRARRSRSGGRTSTGCSPTRRSGWTPAAPCWSTGRRRWSRTGASAPASAPTPGCCG